MTKIYFGCNEIPRQWDRYFSLCNAVELDLGELDNEPRSDTLNRWRVDSPKGFAFVLRADAAVEQGLVAATKSEDHILPDSLLAGWKKTLEQAQSLAARALLIRTPMSFSPGIAERAVITRFAEELAGEFSRPVIWEAQGMWDTEATRELVDGTKLTYAYDPFLAYRDEIGLGHGDGAFILNERAGMRREFDRYDIRALLDRLDSYNRVFVLLRGRFKWEHARHFAELTGYLD